jgi:hypothetical protein
VRELFDGFSSQLRTSIAQRTGREEEFIRRYTGPFERCAASLEKSGDFRLASQKMIEHPGVQRVYLLNGEGRQVGDNLERSASRFSDAMGFGPFLHSEGADWFRRPYFQRAVARPGTVQVSRKYLSIRDARPCVTMSVAIEIDEERRVLCADLDLDATVSGGF